MTTLRLDGPFVAIRRYGLGPLPLAFDLLTLPFQVSNTLTGFPPLEIPTFDGQAPPAPAPSPEPIPPAPEPIPVPGPAPAPIPAVPLYQVGERVVQVDDQMLVGDQVVQVAPGRLGTIVNVYSRPIGRQDYYVQFDDGSQGIVAETGLQPAPPIPIPAPIPEPEPIPAPIPAPAPTEPLYQVGDVLRSVSGIPAYYGVVQSISLESYGWHYAFTIDNLGRNSGVAEWDAVLVTDPGEVQMARQAQADFLAFLETLPAPGTVPLYQVGNVLRALSADYYGVVTSISLEPWGWHYAMFDNLGRQSGVGEFDSVLVTDPGEIREIIQAYTIFLANHPELGLPPPPTLPAPAPIPAPVLRTRSEVIAKAQQVWANGTPFPDTRWFVGRVLADWNNDGIDNDTIIDRNHPQVILKGGPLEYVNELGGTSGWSWDMTMDWWVSSGVLTYIPS